MIEHHFDLFRLELLADLAPEYAIYSLVSTCKGHAVDPRKWMEDVLVKIPQYENQKLDLRKLLPHNWQKEANL